MKLTRVDVNEVIVPVHPDRVHSEGYGPTVFDVAPRFILQAQTDVGIKGLGESHKYPSEQRLRSTLGLLNRQDLTQICLQDPPIFDFSKDNKFANQSKESVRRLPEWSFASMEDMAIHSLLLDLVGKHARLPAHMLMGGAYRVRIPVDGWMGRMTNEDSIRVALEAKAQGYRGIKLKCAIEDDIVGRARAIRDACGPEFKLTVDPNRRFYRPADALPILRQLAEVGNIGCLEDPFMKDNLEWYRMVRYQALFPIGLHLCNGLSLMQAVRSDASDYFNLEGTPWEVRKAGEICWAAGIPTWHYSGVDLGILEAVYLHTCAATKSMSRPSDIFGRSVRVHNLITESFRPIDGEVPVPKGMGLGVDLDFDALKKYTTRRFSIEL
jgi:muconate cycloisomerase